MFENKSISLESVLKKIHVRLSYLVDVWLTLYPGDTEFN